MGRGKVKQVFPGGNTSLGFYSYYDNVLWQDIARRIIILKGGPGVANTCYLTENSCFFTACSL